MRKRHGTRAFLENMKVSRVTEKAMLRFHEGAIGGIPAAAVYSGVCKVNAAIAAELLVEGFGLDSGAEAFERNSERASEIAAEVTIGLL